jgi:hypothetical protein
MNQEFPSQNKALRGKLATTAHGRGAWFLLGNNTVTFSWQTQQNADHHLPITVLRRPREPL